jgi:hypothetical protein
MAYRIQTSKEERKFEAYVKAILGRGTAKEVVDTLAQLEVPQPYRVRVKVVYSRRSPREVIDDLAERRLCSRLARDSAAYSYETAIGRKEPREISVPFLVSGFAQSDIGPSVNAIISVCRSQEWAALRRFLKKQYPRLVPILLSQSELRLAAKMLKRVSDHEVRVTSFSAKESLHGRTAKPAKSVREWTDEELDGALANIQERGQILTSLDVEFYPMVGQHSHIRPNAHCKIRKDGEIEVSGSFRLALETVAVHVAKVGERKLRFYHGRGLREASYTPRPLAINYAQPIFEDMQNVRKLVSVLTDYKDSMHAVIHGNPYAHVRLTDLWDGSSFDVWAVPPQRIALVPGLKASEAAFERLVHFIFEAFHEGKIVTYDREQRALEAT